MRWPLQILAFSMRLFGVCLVATSLTSWAFSTSSFDVGSSSTRQVQLGQLVLQSGETAHLLIEQHDFDLQVNVIAPNGQVRKFDGFERGVEPVSFVADTAGSYEVRLLCVHECPEKAITAAGIRRIWPPRGEDQLRVQAAFLATEAKRHISGLASVIETVQPFKDASVLWGKLKESTFELEELRLLGDFQLSNSEYAAAEISLNSALEIGRRIHDSSVAEIINEIGLCRWHSGFSEEAIISLLDGIRTAESLHRPGIKAKILDNIGLVYQSVGDSDSARDYFYKSLSIFRSIHDKRSSATALIHLGSVSLLRGDISKSRAFLKAAQQDLRFTHDQGVVAGVFSGLCQVEMAARNPDRGIEFCNQALGLYREIGDRENEIVVMNALASAFVASGRRDAATDVLLSALEKSRAMGLRGIEAETLTALASLSFDLGNLEIAEHYASESILLFESLRTKVTADRLRMSYFATKNSAYKTYVDVLMRRHHLNPGDGRDITAFQIAERWRARSLLDELQRPEPHFGNAATDQLRARLRLLRKKLNILSKHQIEQGLSPTDAEENQLKVNTVLREYDVLEAQLRMKSARSLTLVDDNAIDLAELQQLLHDTDILVEFYLGERQSYAWIVTESEFTSVELPPKTLIEEDANAVARLLASVLERRRRPEQQAKLKRARFKLRAEIISPIAEHLRLKNIIFIGDGALQRIPFAALPSENDTRIPLGLAHEITIAPSASVLIALRDRKALRPTPQHSIAVFADPVFSANDPRVSQRTESIQAKFRRTTLSGTLGRLVFSDEEASAIKANSPRDSLVAIGFEASKQKFVSSSIGDYRFLHIATHGFLDTRSPELSSLVFSLLDRRGRPIDGFLGLSEIDGLHLNAELVVLSACDSGLGKQLPGEGIVGFGHAFLRAGAQRVMVSLWPVDDEATAVFMKLFYKGLLSQHFSPAAALRSAQKYMQKQVRWSDPYYWAGFVLEGDD